MPPGLKEHKLQSLFPLFLFAACSPKNQKVSAGSQTDHPEHSSAAPDSVSAACNLPSTKFVSDTVTDLRNSLSAVCSLAVAPEGGGDRGIRFDTSTAITHGRCVA